MRHVVMFSGGVGSWACAKRVAELHGTDDLVLLFADTLIEDEDLYRFIHQAAENVGAPLTRIEEGRDPWTVFNDVRFLGNTRIDPCSRILKREVLRKWLDDNCDPEDTTVYLGLDWTEAHRWVNAQDRWDPWRVRAPLCEPPLVFKQDHIAALKRAGIEQPRLYRYGFPHNNCGGFCIKAGQAHFKLLLEVFPDRFREHEEREQALREYLGKDVAILRDRRGGDTKPMTLRELRRRVEAGREDTLDLFEWGGCGCMVGEDGPNPEAGA